MKFIKLTDRHNSDHPIYLNPEHIVAVRRLGDTTWVHTAAHAKSDSPGAFVVLEMPDDIIAAASR